MDIKEWLSYGLEQDWIIFGCMQHDDLLTEDEVLAHEQGDDPCIPVIRIVTTLF